MSAVPQVLPFVAGEFAPSSGSRLLQSLNPTRPSEVVAEFAAGTASDVARACEVGTEALGAWSRLAGPARAEALYKWADAINARAAELADAVVREVGKPLGEARGEVGRCVAILRYYAGEAVRESGDVIPPLAGGVLQFSLRQPLGLVGLITPWNFPLAIPLWKAAPALAVGNTVVLKPAEESPLCAQLLAETAAGVLPAGVFGMVPGDGEAGAALVANSLVRGLSFTGSAEVGSKIAVACAERNVKFQTEMGGKNPGLVLKDADLGQAANLVAAGAMRFAGQKCTATSRVIVDRAVRDAFVAELVKAIDALPVGDPGELATAVGPVISEESVQRLSDAISGLESVYSGSSLGEGYFIPPTVIATTPDSDLAKRELFGPVLALLEADGLDEAIALANDTPYGLSAALFTKDIPSALSYIGRIEAGMVRVNADTTGVDPHAPFGGVKGSSSHSREQGAVAKDFYTEIRTVQINP